MPGLVAAPDIFSVFASYLSPLGRPATVIFGSVMDPTHALTSSVYVPSDSVTALVTFMERLAASSFAVAKRA